MNATDKMGVILAEACLDKDLRNEILAEHLADMKDSKEKIEELRNTIESLNKSVNENKEIAKNFREKFTSASERLEGYEVREDEISAAENEALTLKLTAQFAETRRQDVMNMFMHVTKNPALTVTKSGNVPIAVEGGGPNGGYCGIVMDGRVDTKETTVEE